MSDKTSQIAVKREDGSIDYIDIGTKAENVLIEDGDVHFSLQDFYQELLVFLEGLSATGVPLEDVTNILVDVDPDNLTATIKWTDPEDLIIENHTLSVWSYTDLHIRVSDGQGSFPILSSEAEIIETSRIRNQYKETGITITGLEADTNYLGVLIPCSNNGARNFNGTFTFTTAVPE